MGRFPTLPSGLLGRVCPGNNVTGGKPRSGMTNHGNRWLGEIRNQCAWAAAHTRDTYLAAPFWRLARRIGNQKAAVAVSHSILVIVRHLLARGCDYQDLGGDWFVRSSDPERRKLRLVNQLQELGYSVTLRPAA